MANVWAPRSRQMVIRPSKSIFFMVLKTIQKARRRVRHWFFERGAKRMSLKRKGSGPFRGPTPSGVFQTVDSGAGTGEYVLGQARRYSQRKYVAIDPRFNPEIQFNNAAEAARLKQNGVHVSDLQLQDFIGVMKQNHWKTRYINVDMSAIPEEDYHVRTFFEELPNVLLPNGKVFFAGEWKILLAQVKKAAEAHGFKTRWRKNFPTRGLRTTDMRKFESMDVINPGIKRLEITYGLKAAIQNKNQRRNWPR